MTTTSLYFRSKLLKKPVSLPKAAESPAGMIIVFYLGLMPPIFEFSKESKPLSNQSNRNHFFSLWFRRVLFFVSLISLIALVAGNILWQSINQKTTEVSEKKSSGSKITRSRSVSQAINLPPLLVSLKGDKGIRMARVHVNLQVSRSSVKKEILSNKKATQKHLLILLSGQQSQDMKNKKSYFENQLLSWMNAFLSKGSVNKVTIQTTLLN